jgi:hypothetical protein
MTSRGYIDFNCDYWCAFCGRKVPKGQEKHDRLGRPIDWKCGHLLRYTVRNKNQGKDKTLPPRPKETIGKILAL